VEECELSLFDVVSMDKDKSPIAAATFKVIEATSSIAYRVKLDTNGKNMLSSESIKGWGWQGVDCQVLQMDGEGWKKGKIRLSLFFIPDEEEEEIQDAKVAQGSSPVSPLDDLREKLNVE
jgi:KGK domain